MTDENPRLTLFAGLRTYTYYIPAAWSHPPLREVFTFFWDHSRSDWVTTTKHIYPSLELVFKDDRQLPIPAQRAPSPQYERAFFGEWTTAGFPAHCPCCKFWLRDAKTVLSHLQQDEEMSDFKQALSYLEQSAQASVEKLQQIDYMQFQPALSELATWNELRYLTYNLHISRAPQLCPHCGTIFASFEDLQIHLFDIRRKVVTGLALKIEDKAGSLSPLAIKMPLLSYIEDVSYDESPQLRWRKILRARWIRFTYALCISNHNATIALRSALRSPARKLIAYDEQLMHYVLCFCPGGNSLRSKLFSLLCC